MMDIHNNPVRLDVSIPQAESQPVEQPPPKIEAEAQTAPPISQDRIVQTEPAKEAFSAELNPLADHDRLRKKIGDAPTDNLMEIANVYQKWIKLAMEDSQEISQDDLSNFRNKLINRRG